MLCNDPIELSVSGISWVMMPGGMSLRISCLVFRSRAFSPPLSRRRDRPGRVSRNRWNVGSKLRWQKLWSKMRQLTCIGAKSNDLGGMKEEILAQLYSSYFFLNQTYLPRFARHCSILCTNAGSALDHGVSLFPSDITAPCNGTQEADQDPVCSYGQMDSCKPHAYLRLNGAELMYLSSDSFGPQKRRRRRVFQTSISTSRSFV